MILTPFIHGLLVCARSLCGLGTSFLNLDWLENCVSIQAWLYRLSGKGTPLLKEISGFEFL